MSWGGLACSLALRGDWVMTVLSASIGQSSDELIQSRLLGGGTWLEEGCASEERILSKVVS